MQVLELKFKGDRNYIQGGDIFAAIERIVRGEDELSFVSRISFRHFGRHDCDLYWDPVAGGERLVAEGNIHTTSGNRKCWVVESQRPVRGRYEFDEEGLVECAVMVGQQISMDYNDAYSPIEQVIALTKRLNYKLSPDVDGRWVFGQLNLKIPMPGIST